MNSKGSDTLLQASSDCRFRLLRTVVEGGTQVDIWDNNRQTPLMLACGSAVESEDKERIIHYLLKKSAKVNLQDLQGRTALMFACSSNASLSVIKALVEAKANPWLADETGCTSFDHAINRGNLETTRLLINSCREHQLLLKTGNAVEMKHLEDCLSKIQEMRKVSWPLMGPSARNMHTQLYSPQAAPVPADGDKLSVESARASPCERRRKRSVCLFDPIDIDEIMKYDEIVHTECQPVSPIEVENTVTTRRAVPEVSSERGTRPPSLSQMAEEERISLHFSSTDSSVEEPSSELETLLKRLKDSTVDLSDTPCTQATEIVATNKQIDKTPCIKEWSSSSEELQHQKSFTEEAPSLNENPTEIPHDATTPCKGSQTLGRVEGKVYPFRERAIENSESDTQKCTMFLQEDSAADKSEAERTKHHNWFHLQDQTTKEHTEINGKRCHTPSPAKEEITRGRTESLSSLTATPTPKLSPQHRRKTLPGTPIPTANTSRDAAPGGESRKTTADSGTPRRCLTLASTDHINQLCGKFALQRLSPSPRDFPCVDAEHRKSPLPRSMSLEAPHNQSSEETMVAYERYGAPSSFRGSNSNLDIVKNSEQLPTRLKESTGKGVQLPAISLQKKRPALLQISTRGPGVTGRDVITEISPRNEELLHIEEKCASPTNRGRVSPFFGRKSPLVAKYEANSASMADTWGKPDHKSYTDVFPGLRQHSPTAGIKHDHDGAKHGFFTTPHSSLEEHEQSKHAPSAPSEKPKKPRTLLPPLRINNTVSSSLDSEDGYYSGSPSPFDIDSPKRTPGHSEQPGYLFRPISPRSGQRFTSH